MVLGKKWAIFDWEWAEIWPMEMGRKFPVSGKGVCMYKGMGVALLILFHFS